MSRWKRLLVVVSDVLRTGGLSLRRPQCSYDSCPHTAPHYHVEDADGERIVWTDA